MKCVPGKTTSIILLSLVLFSAVAAAQSAPAGTNRNPLVGAWKLVSLEEPGADGKLHRADCSGQFVFTNNGKASVQVRYQSPATGGAYAKGGYEASYGSYHLDGSSTFTFHIDGAILQTLIGQDLKRAYEISGSRLTVKSTDPNEHWKVIWERY